MALRTPDLVRDSCLDTEFRSDSTVHIKFVASGKQRARPRRVEEKWIRQRLLGRGSFGQVWLERCASADNDVRLRAVKEITKDSASSQSVDYTNELAAIARFSQSKYEHRFVKSLGWFENETCVFIAMDYHEHGDLQQYLLREFTESETRDIIGQVLDGLKFLHGNDYAHRDLKPGNILVIEPAPEWWVKISDFGISKRAHEVTSLLTVIGTQGYIAPEILGIHPLDVAAEQSLGKIPYTTAVDIWAVGEIGFRLLTREPALPLINDMVSYVRGEMPFPNKMLSLRNVSDNCQELIKWIMSPVPKDRPVAEEALQHSWFKSFDGVEGGMDDKPTGSEVRPTKDNINSSQTQAQPATFVEDAQWSTCAMSTFRAASLGEKSSSNTASSSFTDVTTVQAPYFVKRKAVQPGWAVSVNVSDLVDRTRGLAVNPNDQNDFQQHLGNPAHIDAWAPLPPTLHSASKAVSLRHRDKPASTVKSRETDHFDQININSVASGSTDKAIRLWSTETGTCIHTLKGHSNNVNSVAFSPDSKLVASGSTDKVIRLWSTETGTCIYTLKGHSHYVNSVTFSSDSKLVASGSWDKTIRLWSTETGTCIQTLEGHSHYVTSVDFSPDSKFVASGSADATIRLWSTETETCIQTLEGHNYSVNSVAFSSDSKLVASGSTDKAIRLWSTETGTCILRLKGHSHNVNSVAFSSDTKLVASGSWDKTIRLWSTETGTCIQTLKGHSHYVTSVTFSSDSKLVASGSWDKTIRLWSTETGTCVQTLEGHSDSVNLVAFSSDSKLVASGSADKTIQLWSTETGDRPQRLGFKGFLARFTARN